MAKTKFCPDCNEDRPIDEFGINRTHSSGLQTYCRKHNNARAKARQLITRRADPEKFRRRALAWRHANLERSREQQTKSKLKQKYGLTLEQFKVLQVAAAGRCQICKRKTKKLNIDHDHKTGRVRGLLCGLCNRGLGKFRDSTKFLQAAIAYLLSK